MTKLTKKNDRIKRARKKYLSTKLALDIINSSRKSPLYTSYWRTYRCRDTITIKEGKSQSSYCKNRWCLTCQSIRTAKLINGYAPVLDTLNEPYFVTLTAPTVPAEYLAPRIEEFTTKWRALMKLSVKRKKNLRGIRKCECTARPNGQYHYHYHIIVEGEESASYIVREWLLLNPTAVADAQDFRPCNGKYIELFKYFTKLTTKVGNRQTPIDPKRLDIIFTAMHGSRVYQPFGGIKAISEDIQEVDGSAEEKADGIYQWMYCDWINVDTEEVYSGFNPDLDGYEYI